MIDNTYSVPKKQWKKWNERERYTFNELYYQMTEAPHLFQHPKSVDVPFEHWDTTAWNAAWMAADYAREYDKEVGNR